jgi:hypothetical protein
MGMKQTLEVINRMEADGIVDRYVIGGAVAAYNYVEPAVTEDLDILIIGRHCLRQAWQAFCHRAGIADPCDVQATS